MPVSIVTGAAGFIGSHICDHLLRLGHTVVALDDLSGGKRDNVPDGVIFRLGNVAEKRDVNALFALYRPDYVFHLAAYAAENLSHFIRNHNYTVNLVGSANVINAAVNYGVKRLVFTSSIAVYGYHARDADEHQMPTPEDPYAIAKWAAELDIMSAGRIFGLPYTIFRCHNVYGPKQSLSDGYRNVVAIFMRRCLQGKSMTVFGSGEQTRSFSYIDDVAIRIATSVGFGDTENETINIGSDCHFTVKQLAYAVHDALEMPGQPNIEHLPARQEAVVASANHEKANRIFSGFVEDMSLDDGLACMAAWARTQTLAEPQPFAGIEIAKNLPESWKEK